LAQLQAGHARVRAGQFSGDAQGPGGFDVDQQTDRVRHAIALLGLFQPGDGRQQLSHRFDLGQIEQAHAGQCHRIQVRAEMGAVSPVAAHDQLLVAGTSLHAAQEAGDLVTGLRLAGLGNRVFQVERERIGLAGHGLVEQFRPGAGDEQLATHGFPSSTRAVCRIGSPLKVRSRTFIG